MVNQWFTIQGTRVSAADSKPRAAFTHASLKRVDIVSKVSAARHGWMVNQWFTIQGTRVSAADSKPRAAFTHASLKRFADIKGRLLCPGVRGAAYEHLYGCAPQGILHHSDIAAGCSEDACLGHTCVCDAINSLCMHVCTELGPGRATGMAALGADKD